jgi:hypothetical protein
MKKIHFSVLVIASFVIIQYLSCAATPPAQERQAPQPTQPSAPSTEPAEGVNPSLMAELNTIISRAEEARKRAEDFESPLYFPGEWEAAEALYAQAGLSRRNTNADISKAIDDYKKAAGSFDSIFKLSIPLYAQAMEDEIMASRNNLIARGGRDNFPEHLTNADKTALQANARYEAEDYYSARDSAVDALLMYQILATALDAWWLKWEIDERDFMLYDADNYDRAGEMVHNAIDAYNNRDLLTAEEQTKEIISRYRQVLSTAWEAYAELHSLLADSERQAAIDTRANIASRDYFMIADSDIKIAQKLLEEKRYEEASKIFISAEAMYIITSMSALEKRRMAVAAMREAAEKIEQSSNAARQAEIIIEGGSR